MRPEPTRAARRSALVGLVLAGALTVTAACTGSGDGEGDGGAQAPATPVGPDFPSSVDTTGPITDPVMEAVWLVRSTGTAEAGSYDLQGQGLFVDGDIAVYYALDTILGVSLTDGSTIWRTPIDMGGEIIEHAGTATHGDHRWSFVYPETHADDLDRWGDHLVTIDVRTGDVVADKVLGTMGTVKTLTSAGGEDYLATDRGIFQVTDQGGLRRILSRSQLPGAHPEVLQIVPIAGSDILTVRTGERGDTTTAIAGLDPSARRLVWHHDVADFAGNARESGYVDVSPGDGRYVTRTEWDRRSNETLNLWVLEPDTGDIRVHRVLPQRNQTTHDHLMLITAEDVGPGDPYGMFPVGEDIVFEDYHGVSRYAPLQGRFLWSVRVGLMGLRNSDASYATFGLGPMSPDEHLVYAAMSSAASGDLLAIDLDTGEVKGRWAMDDKVDAGLVSRPLMVLHGDQMLLARNRAVEGDPALMDQDAKPLGKLNDLGLLRFPDLDD